MVNNRVRSIVWKVGCTLLKTKKKEAGAMVGEGSSNITTKLIILFPFIVS